MASLSVTMSRSVTSSGVSQSDPLWHLLVSRYSWSDAGNRLFFFLWENNVCLAIVDCDIDDEWPLVWYCWLGCFVRTSAGRSSVQILVSLYLLYFVLCICCTLCILVFCQDKCWAFSVRWRSWAQIWSEISSWQWSCLDRLPPPAQFLSSSSSSTSPSSSSSSSLNIIIITVIAIIILSFQQ